jgi:hypothetical protein
VTAISDITPTSRRTPRGVLFRVPEKKKAKEEVQPFFNLEEIRAGKKEIGISKH